MANAITLPYSTPLTTYGSALSSTYTWYEQWYVYPTITDKITSQAQITINSIMNSERTKRVKLPSGYTQLEYIESDGNQYIDTGFSVTPDNYNKLKYVTDMESLGSSVNSSRSITANNIGEFFQVSNGQYFFAGSGSTFTTNNLGIASSTATTTLTALYDMSSLSFSYSYSSESNCDKLTITVAGTTVANALSGSGSSSYSGSIKKGQTIVFTYTKDGSVNSNNDICTFSAMKVSTKHDAWAVDGVMVDGNRFYIGSYNSFIYYGNCNADVNTSKRYDFIRHTFMIDSLNGSVSVSNLYEATYAPVAPTLSLNFYLFAYNKNGTACKGVVRNWGSELYENNVLVHKFVPCIEDATGAIGMYDIVTNTFFGNNGTGTFTYGELKSGYVDVSFTIYSKNAITRTGTNGHTCTTFTYESQPTIKVNNVKLGESIELYDGELTTTVADNGVGTAVSGAITHSATVVVQIPRNWFLEDNSEWNYSISDALMIMNTSANKTNTHTFANFNVAPLFNIWVRKPIGLPEGYTQLKYIEGTGTQYVDTGFKPNQDTRLILDIDIASQSYPIALLGARDKDTSSGQSFVMFLMTASQFRTDFGSATVNADISTVGRFLIDKNKNICTINGTEYINTPETFQSSYTLSLLTENDVGGYDTRITNGKIYFCQIYDNGTLVRDYIPCINDSGVVGLYDLVNGVFYGDASGGTFIAGEEVNVNKSKSVLRRARKIFTKKDGILYEVTTFKMRVGGEIV